MAFFMFSRFLKGSTYGNVLHLLFSSSQGAPQRIMARSRPGKSDVTQTEFTLSSFLAADLNFEHSFYCVVLCF